jgi:hypothetical protein
MNVRSMALAKQPCRELASAKGQMTQGQINAMLWSICGHDSSNECSLV